MTAVEPTGEPWPFAWPPSEHCHWHEAHEPTPSGGAYIVCGECGHVYATPEELVDIFVNEAPPDFPVTLENISAESIRFCPYCIHDF